MKAIVPYETLDKERRYSKPGYQNSHNDPKTQRINKLNFSPRYIIQKLNSILHALSPAAFAAKNNSG
jgi:hypothetical protein